MSNIKTIYHGECHHLHTYNIQSDECLKRCFYITDVLKNDYYKLAFCNEYLRLKLHEKAKKENIRLGYSYEVDTHNFVMKFLEEIIIDSCDLDLHKDSTNRFRNKKSLIEKSLNIQVCERPHLYQSVSFKEAFNIYYFSENIKDAVFCALNEPLVSYTYQFIISLKKNISLKSFHKEADYIKERLDGYRNLPRERLMNFMIEALKMFNPENK